MVCGSYADGTVKCWNSEWVSPPDPRQPFYQMAPGWSHGCGINMNASLQCWGARNPLENTLEGPWTAVSSAQEAFYSCAIRPDRNDSSVLCFLFATTFSPPLAGEFVDTVYCFGAGDSLVTSSPTGMLSQLSVSTNRACGLARYTDDPVGPLKCWGAGLPLPANLRPPMRMLVASTTATCGLLTTGNTVCWGTSR